jgi:DNA-binding response OmpR family regulator
MSSLSIAALILEDDDGQAENIKYAFGVEYPNASFTIASSGKEFLRLLQRSIGSGVDLIILDINVPEPNGIEILRRLRLKTDENPRGCTIPTVMFTTGASNQDEMECLSLGAKAVIKKPPVDEFPRKIKEMVDEYVRYRSEEDAMNDTLSGVDIQAELARESIPIVSFQSVDELLESW